MKLRNILTATAVAMTLSFTAYAGNTGMYNSKGTTQLTMHNMMKNMQSEMENIVNTEDRKTREALFATHKGKMHEMVAMMTNTDANCTYQGGTHAIDVFEEYSETD